MAAKTSEWRPGPTVCRCCLTEGCYKDISTEYFWMGRREVYEEMLKDTLEITISYSKAGGPNSNSRLICEPCISRLRDATEFKRQVVECERMFMHHLDPASTSQEIEVEAAPVEKIKVEGVKLENSHSDDDFGDHHFGDDDDDDDDLDNQPLTKLASKIPKKESVDFLDLLDNSKAAEKRKATSKAKAPPPKKTKTKVEPPSTKPSSSKAKPEKKKKDPVKHAMAKRNAEIMLQYMTVHPFRVRGHIMVCVYCWEEYDDPVAYKEHMLQSHKQFTLSTAFAHCRYRKDSLKVDCSDIKCRRCNQGFEDLDSAAQHIIEFHEPGMKLNYGIGLQPYKLCKGNWSCYNCDKKLPSLTKLCRHTASHFLDFTCDVCGKSYLTKEALKYHSKCSHSGKHQCRKCWREFESLEQKTEHQKESKQCRPFCCVQCGERFCSWEKKKQHLNQEHQVPQSVYPCPECGSVYKDRKRFYNHFKLVHTDENFTCSCCGLKFTTKNELDDHRLGHTGEKPFICPVCFKTFSRSKSIKQHMWIHSDVKRFACNICDKQFAQKVSLKNHMKSHHPEVTLEV